MKATATKTTTTTILFYVNLTEKNMLELKQHPRMKSTSFNVYFAIKYYMQCVLQLLLWCYASGHIHSFNCTVTKAVGAVI